MAIFEFLFPEMEQFYVTLAFIGVGCLLFSMAFISRFISRHAGQKDIAYSVEPLEHVEYAKEPLARSKDIDEALGLLRDLEARVRALDAKVSDPQSGEERDGVLAKTPEVAPSQDDEAVAAERVAAHSSTSKSS